MIRYDILLIYHLAKGRTRFGVQRLKGNPDLKIYLESSMRSQNGVNCVTANSTNGSVLILHHERLGFTELLKMMENVIQSLWEPFWEDKPEDKLEYKPDYKPEFKPEYKMNDQVSDSVMNSWGCPAQLTPELEQTS